MAEENPRQPGSEQEAPPAKKTLSIRWLTIADLVDRLNKAAPAGAYPYDELEILTYAKHFGLPIYRHKTEPVEGTIFRQKVLSVEILRGQGEIPRELVQPDEITVGLLNAPPWFREEDVHTFDCSAVPRWITGGELLKRWPVRLEDLKTHVRDFGLPVYSLPILTPVQDWTSPPNALSYILYGNNITRSYFFQIDQIEKFENDHPALRTQTDTEQVEAEPSAQVPSRAATPANMPVSTVVAASEPRSEERTVHLTKSAGGWVIEFEGKKTACPTKGMDYVAYLVCRPDQSFHVKELDELVEGVNPDTIRAGRRLPTGEGLTGESSVQDEEREHLGRPASAQSVDVNTALGHQEILEIRSKLNQLKADKAAAERDGDKVVAQECQEEMDGICTSLAKEYTPQHIKAILGTTATPSALIERNLRQREEYQRINKLLKDTYDKLDKGMPDLANYLKTNISYKGGCYRYRHATKNALEFVLDGE